MAEAGPHFGHRANAAGHSKTAKGPLRWSLVVVVRLSSASQRRWIKALGCAGASLILEAALARQAVTVVVFTVLAHDESQQALAALLA